MDGRHEYDGENVTFIIADSSVCRFIRLVPPRHCQPSCPRTRQLRLARPCLHQHVDHLGRLWGSLL